MSLRKYGLIGALIVALVGAAVVYLVTSSLNQRRVGSWSDRLACKLHMSNVYSVLTLYARDHEGRLPEKLDDLIPCYPISEGWLRSPAMTRARNLSDMKRCRFEFPASNSILADMPEDAVLLAEPVGVNDRVVENGYMFPRGHHVLRKDRRVYFIEDP